MRKGKIHIVRFICAVLLGLQAYEGMAQVFCKQTAAYSIREGLSDRTVFDVKKDSLGYLWIGTASGLNRFDGHRFLNLESLSNPQISTSRIERIEVLDRNRLMLIPGGLSSVCYLFDTNTFESWQIVLPSGAASIFVDHKGMPWTLSRIGRDIVVYQFTGQQSFVERYRVSCEDAFPAYFAGTRRLIIDENGRHIIHTGEKTWMVTDGNGRILSEFKSDTEGEIRSSAIDGSTRLWIIFRQSTGVYNLDVQRGKLIKNARILPESFLLNIWVDSQGNLLFSEKEKREYYVKSLTGLDIKSGSVVDFSCVVERENRITSICAYNFFDYLYLGSHIGIFNISTSVPPIHNLQKTDIPLGHFGTIVRGIARGNDGKIYFTKESNDWFVYDPASGKNDTLIMFDENSGNKIHPSCNLSLLADSGGYIWGSSCETEEYQQSMLIRYNPATGKARTFICPEKGSIRHLLADQHGQGFWLLLYVETYGTVLLFFDTALEKFSNHTQRFLPELLSKTRPNNLRYIDDKRLLLATHKGMIELHLEQNIARALLQKSGESSVDNIAVMSMEPMPDGAWLLGTEGRGLMTYDLAQDKIMRTYNKTDGLPNNWVCSILPDDDGRYWLGTFYGISCFDPNTHSFRNYFTQEGLSDNEMNRRAQFADKQSGVFYLGSMNGLNFFKPKDLLKQPAVNNGQIVITRYSFYDRNSGKIIETEKGADDLTLIELPSNNRFFTLTAALTDLKAPEQHRLEFRISGLPDYENWRALDLDHRVHFDYLPAGKYTLHIRAQNHYGVYSRFEKTIRIEVSEHLYKRFWFIALIVLAVMALFYSVYQYRLRELLRMDRLRNNISSDLHDEVGGVLAGIAMQADLLEGVIDERFQPWVNRISTNCRKAAATMRDIVWSIDARRDTYGDLLLRMKDFAAETLSISEITTDWDIRIVSEKEKLPSHIRHHIYLIYKELVTNCLKHSDATHVWIRLEKRRGTLYFAFKDNGSGFDTEQTFSGMGLSNIFMRAKRMNAQINLHNDNGAGLYIQIPMP